MSPASQSLADSPQGVREFEIMVRTHEAALQAVALRLCRDSTDARDLVQDTLERALRAFSGLQPGSNTRSWLMSIMRNRFIDACRRSTRAPRATGDIEEAADEIGTREAEAEPQWAAITQDQLRSAVDSLGEEFRLVYVLHAVEGRSYIEISERLGIPKATVGTRLLRARKKLKELLEPMLAQEAES
ncbi:MAG: RNA polymerase sigma factor [Deltaproteobacteria bacterium]|nr:RNA polymerase sigma factor [Deltaproteobacteria bacterium]